jgi:hypothetical protein
MVQFLNFRNSATYRVYEWLSKTVDVDAMIADAAVLVPHLESGELPQKFSDDYELANELANTIGACLDELKEQCLVEYGLDCDSHTKAGTDEHSILAAMLFDSIMDVHTIIVAKALLIKAERWNPSLN